MFINELTFNTLPLKPNFIYLLGLFLKHNLAFNPGQTKCECIGKVMFERCHPRSIGVKSVQNVVWT